MQKPAKDNRLGKRVAELPIKKHLHKFIPPRYYSTAIYAHYTLWADPRGEGKVVWPHAFWLCYAYQVSSLLLQNSACLVN